MSEVGSQNDQPVRSLQDLRVYRMAMELAKEVHQLTLGFPSYARNEMGRQMRLSADSVPANIAEGCGRSRYTADFKRFLVNALGSCTELGCQLDMALGYGYISEANHEKLQMLREHLGRSLHVMIQKWRGSLTSDT